jgi:hypothetical protein
MLPKIGIALLLSVLSAGLAQADIEFTFQYTSPTFSITDGTLDAIYDGNNTYTALGGGGVLHYATDPGEGIDVKLVNGLGAPPIIMVTPTSSEGGTTVYTADYLGGIAFLSTDPGPRIYVTLNHLLLNNTFSDFADGTGGGWSPPGGGILGTFVLTRSVPEPDVVILLGVMLAACTLLGRIWRRHSPARGLEPGLSSGNLGRNEN